LRDALQFEHAVGCGAYNLKRRILLQGLRNQAPDDD
jgi:hypothetical protein